MGAFDIPAQDWEVYFCPPHIDGKTEAEEGDTGRFDNKAFCLLSQGPSPVLLDPSYGGGRVTLPWMRNAVPPV